MQFYVDGVLDKTANYPTDFQNNHILYFGRSFQPFGEYFNGTI